MAVWQVLLIILAVLLALVLLCFAVLYLERRFPSKKFDERQKQARGNAYRLSFEVGSFYLLAVYCYLTLPFWEGEGKLPADFLIYLGFTIQMMVFHVYCLLTHASLPLSEKPGAAALAFLFFGALGLATADYSAPISLTEFGRHRCLRLVNDVFWLALAVIHMIDFFRQRKE